MRKPNESLDEYRVPPEPELGAEPPRTVWLWRTGKVEVLKPLATAKVRSHFRAFPPRVSNQPLWFRRFLAVGSGALVFIALVLVSAILISINEPLVGPDVVRNEKPENQVAKPQEPFNFDIPSPTAFSGVEIVWASTSRRISRPSIRLTVNKLRRVFRSPLRPDKPKFIPTTLVIYAENGVITSRIEPWIQTGDKKTPARAFNN